jgi:hypothetical protein
MAAMIRAMVAQHVPLDPIAVRNKADWLWLAVQLQSNRLIERAPRGRYPSSMEGVQISNEFDFLINAINRLLRLAKLAVSHGLGGNELRDAVETFSAAAPAVGPVRDTAEHFDEYSLGKGNRQRQGEPISSFLYTLYPDEVLVTYAAFQVPVRRTTSAARQLHRAIRAAVDGPSRADPAWDEPIVDLGVQAAG